MNITNQLHLLGQCIWLDNISRALLTNGGLSRYIQDLTVTGLTSNPSIFDKAIGNSDSYDKAIAQQAKNGKSGEELFFELALEDLTAAADLLRPIYDQTEGTDGCVSLEVSPLLASDAAGTLKSAKALYAQAQRPNLLIKIPGTPEGLLAIEEAIFAGVNINVTLLFSCEQYLAAACAYMRGIERRIEAGLDPRIRSVASIFVSRWDVAVKNKVPKRLRNRLGIAICHTCYRAYCELLLSPRWRKLAAAGALPQTLLWASTGTKDPDAPDTLYIGALAVADTINTVPEKTLLAIAKHDPLKLSWSEDDHSVDKTLIQFRSAGIELEALALQLQIEGAASFVSDWHQLLGRIAEKSHRTAVPLLAS
ncbi:transaldolase [Simiduia litorea]|uniref:transaldolase n=1 Tax=Simiduia litorea TaxID=1435348 RepID=UPI0036F36A8F